MTDEEMAYEYAKYDDNGRVSVNDDKFKAFLAGLEAGRPKWHKVADGDLPKDENDVLVYSGEDWRMCVGRYSPKYKAWETGCDTIAWCEIPKYTEE
jgi:hypothetical protein